MKSIGWRGKDEEVGRGGGRRKKVVKRYINHKMKKSDMKKKRILHEASGKQALTKQLHSPGCARLPITESRYNNESVRQIAADKHFILTLLHPK